MHGLLVAERADWTLPTYAHDMLWISDGVQHVRTAGERGSFVLESEVRASSLELTWGTPEGPPLGRWAIDPGADAVTLGWLGHVTLGGFVERLHIREVRGLSLLIADVSGTLLPDSDDALPALEDYRQGITRPRPEDDPDQPERTYPLITQAESVLAEYLHHALVSELAVDCSAVLGPQAGRWHTVIGLPLLLEALTLLGPGAR